MGDSSLPDLRTQIMCLKVVHLQELAYRLGVSRSGTKATVQGRILSFLGLTPSLGQNHVDPNQKVRLDTYSPIVNDVYRKAHQIAPRKSTSHVMPIPANPTNRNPVQSSGSNIGRNVSNAVHSNVIPLRIPNSTFTSSPSHARPPPPPLAPSSQGAHISIPQPVPGIMANNNKFVRCICRASTVHQSMVQCKGPGCGVWQHTGCVGNAPGAQQQRQQTGSQSQNADFYCEQCRAALADPFWMALEMLLPVKWMVPVLGAAPLHGPGGESLPQQSGDLAVYLNDILLNAAKKTPDLERIQVGCILLEDVVQCRYHWPRNVTMRVNSIQYRPYSRGTTVKMGINQRDEVASIASLCLNGRNSVAIQAAEGGTWLLLLQRARKRTLNEVKSMMAPKETDVQGEERVVKFMHGGDANNDDIIAVASQIISVVDPLTNERITVPVRFTDASGLQPFDLDTFLSMVERNRKWQDPTTLKNSTIDKLHIDGYMDKVLACISGLDDVKEIEIDDTGLWRPIEEGASASLSEKSRKYTRWHRVLDSVDQVRIALNEEASIPGKGEVLKGSGSARDGGKDGQRDDDEEDEEEELRKAGAALRKAATELAGQKRKEPEPSKNKDVEVISLLTDDEDGM